MIRTQGIQIEGRITNLRYADDIVLHTDLEAELQEMVNRLKRAGRDYLFIWTHGRLQEFLGGFCGGRQKRRVHYWLNRQEHHTTP